MNDQSPFQNYARAIQHFASTRALEVIALQASPLLGAFRGGFQLDGPEVFRLGLLLLGSLALTAHVFVFNDWSGYHSDRRDPRRASLLFDQRGISRHQVARIAIALLILANLVFTAVGTVAMLLGAAIASLSLLYSAAPEFGKTTPFAASLNHLIGGSLHFLLGYTLFHTLDLSGLMISLFFGLVFAAGHLNQEVRDYAGDRLNRLRTCAVVFGARPTFFASLGLFTAAYAMIIGLVTLGFLPRLLLWSAFLWPLQVAWSLQALRRGLSFETAIWMQQRYRLLFAVIGIGMLTP